MSFVCPHCNPQTVRFGGKAVKFTKASRCGDTVRGRSGAKPCTGLVCGTCGRCQRDSSHWTAP